MEITYEVWELDDGDDQAMRRWYDAHRDQQPQLPYYDYVRQVVVEDEGAARVEFSICWNDDTERMTTSTLPPVQLGRPGVSVVGAVA